MNRRLHRTAVFLMGTILSSALLAVWQNGPIPASAANVPAQKANRFDPTSQSASINHLPPLPPAASRPAAPVTPSRIRSVTVPMKPGIVDLDPLTGAHFMGSDGRLEITVPPSAITDSDVRAAGGKLRLTIRQVAPASGSNAGGSGHISFGTFLIQVTDASGRLASHGLGKPITLTVHFASQEQALNLEHAYVVINGSVPAGVSLNPDASGPVLTATQAGLGKLQNQPLKVDTGSAVAAATSTSPPLGLSRSSAQTATSTSSVTLMAASPSTSASFNSNSPIATFGKPDPFNVDLSAGSLTASYPIDLPQGPGGLTPPLQLGYSSAAVAEQHNPQAAAPWVGEGWNLGLGSISWSEHDVAAGCELQGTCGPNWKSSWQLNDPYGTGAELIPPTSGISTYNDDTGHGISPSPITWHTAPETHAKILSFAGGGAVSDPAAVSWGSNRIDFFVRGADNAIWHDWWNNGWGNWESLGGYLLSNPGVASWGPNRLDVFAVGNDKQVYLRTWTGTTWAAWYSIGGPPGGATSDPAAVSWGPNRIDIFVRGADNAIWHQWWNNGWGIWQPLPNFVAGSGPGVAAWGVNRLDLFAAGTDSQLYHQSWNGSTWQGSWDMLGSPPGGPITSKPSAVSWGPNRIDVFARGTDGAIWHRAWAPGWYPWDSIGGWLTSGAGVASWGSGRLDVFARGTDNGIYHDAFQGQWYGWGYLAAPPLPCFRVYLPNGIMEEFGCTPDALQFYVVPSGPRAGTVYLANWLLDLITDPRGNQIHVSYQLDNSLGYPRDAVLGTVEYDSPGCRDAQRACTGSSWAPLMRVNFVAGHGITHVAGSSCQANGTLRCDDPVDLSGSGGLVNPTIQNTFVLNDIQVQVRGSSGTTLWNTLRTYQLGYDQGAAVTKPDPLTGKNMSTAGRLNLTQLAEIGADGSTALPTRSFVYTPPTGTPGAAIEYYEDDYLRPTPSTSCGPIDNRPGCILWSQSYEGNSYYLATVSNGLGVQQTFSWDNARNNTWGGAGGRNLDPLSCNGVSASPCNFADDQNWSHIVLTKETGAVIRTAQNGQGGTVSNTPVTSTTTYAYQLSSFAVQACSGCAQGFYWGNQKDGDYLDYYNGKFTGFAQSTVAKPDGAVEIHKYYSSLGWGVYDCGQVSCSGSGSYCQNPCSTNPWWQMGNAGHGHEFEADFSATDGFTPLRQMRTQYSLTCPPAGVAGTPPAGYGNWNGKLVSELDPSNPVASCDIQTSQVDDISLDGTPYNSSLPDNKTTYSYDSYGRLTNETTTSNNGGGTGSATTTVHKPTYVWNDNVSANATGSWGTYLINFQAFTGDEDTGGNRNRCAYTSYDGQPYTIGASGGLTLGEVTQTDRYTNCGTAANSFNDRSGAITTTHTYDNFGNPQTTNDPDANAGNTAHLGCTVVGSTRHSDCTTYDGTFGALPTSHSNALAQTTTTTYQSPNSGTAPFGYGLWPVSTTDVNTQTTAFTYDALGRPASQILPGDTTSAPTVAFAYKSWCSGTAAQSPCLEIDQTQRLNSTTTVTSRAFYDGWGNLVETRVPAPNNLDVVRYAYYDTRVRLIFQSVAYFVPAYIGDPGSAAYSLPDSQQSGSNHGYDGLGRLLSTTDPLGQGTSNAISVACNAAGTNDAACYEQTLTVDPLSHQSGGLVDAFGRKQYLQLFTGNSTASYAPYATTQYTYDVSGTLTRILYPGGAATTTFVHDTSGRKTSMTDPDVGTANYFYDQNGNATQSVDARGSAGTVYAQYDGLNRPIWRNTTNTLTGAYQTFTYDSVSGGNNGVGRLTSETFTGGANNTLSGSYSYSYDARGQETSSTLTVGGTPYPVQNTFDDAGNKLTQQYPTGEVVTTGYTGQGWLSSVGTTQGNTSLLNAAGYSGFGGAAQQLTSANLAGSQYQYSANFDALLRPVDVKVTNGATVLFDQARGFDRAGNVTSANTTLSTGTDNQAFCYDELDRLTWAGATGTPPCGTSLTPGTLSTAQYQRGFSYDTLGRLTGGSDARYSYGAPLHAVYSILFQGPKGRWMYGYSATYDAAGNMTCRDVTGGTATCGGTNTSTNAIFSYDNEGTLAAWQNSPTSPTATASFLYDGHGNRVEQVVTQGGATTTTVYVGNLEQVATTGPTTTTTTYYYAGSARIALAINGTFSYLASDGLGSANVALNASGSATASALYQPYGFVRYSSGTMPTDYGFSGQHADSVTGLDYFNARYYDPVAAAFTSADTILPGDGYDILGLSRYAYVEGNPETRTDPSGHCPWCIAAVVGGLIGGGLSYGSQVVGNVQHGQSLGSALTHVDVGEIGKAALVGAVIGATGGLGGAAIGGRLVLGGAQGVGTQIGDNLLHGRSWDQDLVQAGAFGVATAGLSAGGGAALRQALKRLGKDTVADGAGVLRNATAKVQAELDSDPTRLANRFLTEKERAQLYNNPKTQSMFYGKLMHLGVNEELNADPLTRGRFGYSRRGPDFYDRVEERQLELTTEDALAAHKARLNLQGLSDDDFITYRRGSSRLE